MPTRVKASRGSGKPAVRPGPRRQAAPQGHRGDNRAALAEAGDEKDIERNLDEALEGTFPASDPVALAFRGD
jgi:hypothetical protein